MKEMEIPHDLLEKLEAVSKKTGWQIHVILKEAMMCYLSDLEASQAGEESNEKYVDIEEYFNG